jgi:two-component system chemotaxis response regulator CheY
MRQVWIVDDDDEMNRAIGLMLKILDSEVTAFQSARLAVQALLSGQKPELLILDINMPEVSGLDFLEFVRRRNEWKHIPVIMLSSEAAESMIDKALKMGAEAYMMKPITLEELERAITIAFEKHVNIK